MATRARSFLWACVVAAAATDAAAGRCAVLFADGRELEVERLEPTAAGAVLHFPDGSRILVPEQRIASWQELPDVVDPTPRDGPEARPAVSQLGGWRAAAGPYADVLETAAQRHALDPALLTAMARVESGFDPHAVSPKGARGLLQLIPETARRFGVADPFDVPQNVEGGARYMRWLLERYEGRPDLALAGYNAGEGAVDRHGGVPPYRETLGYVADVLRLAASFSTAR